MARGRMGWGGVGEGGGEWEQGWLRRRQLVDVVMVIQ